MYMCSSILFETFMEEWLAKSAAPWNIYPIYSSTIPFCKENSGLFWEVNPEYR